MKNKLAIYMAGIMLLWSTSSCWQNNSKPKQQEAGVGLDNKDPVNPLNHYWDRYDFTDTVAMKKPEIGEQAFVDFLGLLARESDQHATAHIQEMLTAAEVDSVTFSHFITLSEKYLYHPNSPMYNESYYESVLALRMQSDWSDEGDKLRAKKQLDLVRKNKPGEQAEDFSYRLSSGELATLQDVAAPYTVLFFYEPGCPSCEEAIAQLVNNPTFANLVGKKEVKVLAVYASGERSVWENYHPSMPPDWRNAFDEKMSILKKDLYDLKASPTIYLLDKEKRVILKDADVPSLLHYFLK